MRARQVDQLQNYVVDLEFADMTFDRDTRIVANTLIQTGKSIKEGALAGIGAADNCDAGIKLPAYGYLVNRNSDCFVSHQRLREIP